MRNIYKQNKKEQIKALVLFYFELIIKLKIQLKERGQLTKKHHSENRYNYIGINKKIITKK